MDPYLEATWSDVHVKLIGFIGEALTPMLPPALRARAEEEVILEEHGEPSRRYRPDVALVRAGRHAPARRHPRTTSNRGPGLVVPEPIAIEFADGPRFDRFVKIIDVRNGNRLVTAIEVLSPWNKRPGSLNARYMKKVDDYVRAGVNIVEIDLLRSPREALTVTEMDLPPDRRTPYLVCVQKSWQRGRWEAYPVELRAPIPAVHVPLRPTDDPAVLRLQPLIRRVYAAGGYDDIDYARPPRPALSPADEVWADGLLRRLKRRPASRRVSGK
jgi:hypothetical protein